MKLIFHSKTNSYADILATARAQRVWKEGRSSIVAALEQTSQLKFLQTIIHAKSGEFGDANSGIPGVKAMSLPIVIKYESTDSYYPNDLEYLGLITHELAHHLLLEHHIVAPPGQRHDLEAHQHIYLFLLDAWQLAFDNQKTKKLTQYEINYAEPNGYAQAIRWAQQLGKEKRQETMAYLKKHKQLPHTALLESDPR